MAFSDNGQSEGWNSTDAGPVYLAAYRVGLGCRVWNTHTDSVIGDWGPTGQLSDGQHNYIAGTISGTPTPGATLTQASTGATTQYVCSGNLLTGQTAPSGYSYNQYVCGLSSPTSWEVGLIYGTADSVHAWSDGSGNSITSSIAPTSVPFYYPDPMHDSSQSSNPTYTNTSLLQPGNGKVIQVQGSTPKTGQTTLTFSKAVTSFLTDRQLKIYNLSGAHDGYLNCGDANHCPVWTIIDGVPTGGGATSLVIDDTANPNGTYSDTETQPSGCTTSCPVAAPNGLGINTGFSFMSDPNFWNVTTLTVNALINLQGQGHAAYGHTGTAAGTDYTWFDYANPSLPCMVNGPATPCPYADTYSLLPSALPEDDHWTYNNHGLTDQTPMATVLTNVCGQASGAGSNVCIQAYTKAWESEVVGMENDTSNASATHCNYGSGTAPCTYRFAHTFNSNDNWEFNAQNAIGNITPDGQWLAFPSSWMNTLGCMDGTTNCYGSYVASGPPNASLAGATIQTDENGVITVTMPNQFCAPNGNQYYWTGSAVTTIACGSLPEQVTLSGFAESWANQTITLTAVSGCDSTDSNAGNCASFSGTGTGVPENYGPVTEASGTQRAAPVNCKNGGTSCQRSDIWIVKLTSAY